MDIVIRATIVYAFLFVVLRMMGPREFSEMSPFEFIVAILIGDLVQQAITQNDFSLTGGALAVTTILFWTLALSWISVLQPRLGKLLDGTPRIIVRDGDLLENCAHPLRITRQEIESAMRERDIASLSEVALAVIEPDGKITFLREQRA